MLNPDVQSRTQPRTSRAGSATPYTSTIKWFDPQRRFGFINPHDGGGDIHFSFVTLLKNHIRECDVLPDMLVQFSFAEPDEAGKRRTVIHMTIDI